MPNAAPTEPEPTPGPWKWDWRPDPSGLAAGAVFSEPHPGHAYAIAICPQFSTQPQWEADATLISAAPDMLAALRSARRQLEEYEQKLTGESYNDTQINAAIAKAGVQP